MRVRVWIAVAAAMPLVSACASRHIPRTVAVPVTCDALIEQASRHGMSSLTEADKEQLLFCQQQMTLRTAEEQAASARDQGRAARLGYTLSLIVSAASLILSIVSLAQ